MFSIFCRIFLNRYNIALSAIHYVGGNAEQFWIIILDKFCNTSPCAMDLSDGYLYVLHILLTSGHPL